jgi:hypothetical protein
MSYRKNGWQLTGSIGPRFWLSGLWPQFGHCSRSSISQRSSEYSGVLSPRRLGHFNARHGSPWRAVFAFMIQSLYVIR